MVIEGIECGVAGYYTFELNGVPVFSEPSKNLITDFGWARYMNLGAIAANNSAQIQVGTSNTPPAGTDTSLGGFVASKNYAIGPAAVLTNGTDTVGTYRGKRMTYVFAQGAVVGNIAEVGHKVAAADVSLSSRSLVKDGAGNPAIIVCTAIDQLTVTYEVRHYLNRTLSTTGVLNVAGVPTTWTLMCAADDAEIPADDNIYGLKPLAILGSATGPNTSYVVGSTFAMGAVGANPTGTQVSLGARPGLTDVAVNPTTGVLTCTLPFATGAANTGTGIYGMRFAFCVDTASNSRIAALGTFKLSFSPPIPKDSTKTLSFTFSFTFVRV